MMKSLESGNTRIVLNGSAGVGKTTCVNELISKFILSGMYGGGTIYILAPTNKAVGVLISKNNEEDYKEFKTVHSALCLVKKVNEDTGKISFVKDPKRAKKVLDDADLVIIDEASMLNKDIIKMLVEFDIPMIFIGDKAQLPPVGETESAIFSSGYETFELTEIIRQTEGNPIIELSRNLEEVYNIENKINKNKEGYAYTNNLDVCIDKILKDIDNVKYLSWTNADCDQKNRIIRERRYGEDADDIMDGEIIVMTEPFGRFYYTSEEVKVSSVIVKDIPVNIIFTGKEASTAENIAHSRMEKIFKCYFVNNNMPIIHEDALNEYEATLKAIKSLISAKIATWKDFYAFKELFGYYNYSYALTVHKSQGSTYQTTIVNLSDLKRSYKYSEHDNLWYTAITRASKNLILYIQ